jgi:hypothetical protein
MTDYIYYSNIQSLTHNEIPQVGINSVVDNNYGGVTFDLNASNVMNSAFLVKFYYSSDNFATENVFYSESRNYLLNPSSDTFLMINPGVVGAFKVKVKLHNPYNEDVCYESNVENVTFSAQPSIVLDNFTDNGNGTGTYDFTLSNSSGTNEITGTYSIDGGATWHSFITAYSQSNGSFFAVVPNPKLGTVKVVFAVIENSLSFNSPNYDIIITSVPNAIINSYSDNGDGYSSISFDLFNMSSPNNVSLQLSNDNFYSFDSFYLGANFPSSACSTNKANTKIGACKARIYFTMGTMHFYSAEFLTTLTTLHPMLNLVSHNDNGIGVTNYAMNLQNGGGTNTVYLEYSNDNGTTWNLLQALSDVPDGTTTIGNITNPGTGYNILRLRINTGFITISDDTWGIVFTAPDVNISFTNVLDNGAGGSTYYYSITGLLGTSGTINLYTSTDGGATWTDGGAIATGMPNGTWSTLLPINPTTGNVLVKLVLFGQNISSLPVTINSQNWWITYT